MAEPAVVTVKLTNRWASFLSSYPDEIRSYYTYKFPNYYFSPKYRSGVWDGTICLLKYRKVASGLFLATRRKIEEELGVTFDVYDERRRLEYQDVSSDRLTNRQFQWDCLTAMQRTRTGGLILSATGTGKTFIAGMYFKSLEGKGVFIVDELTLLDQAREELSSVLGERVGIIGDQKFRPRRITVATIQTLHKHRTDKRFKPWQQSIDVMMIDEVHLALNRRNVDTVKNIQPAVVFGFTATLQLKKPQIRLHAYALAGPVLYEYSMERGVKEKYLSPGIGVGIDIVQAGTDDEYSDAYVKKVVFGGVWNRVLTSLVRVAYKRKYSTIVLVERIKHLKMLSRELSDIPHRLAFGEVNAARRKSAKQVFEQGRVRLLIANKVFKKGVNIKRVNLIIDGASMASENDAVQKFGRGVRLYKGKLGLIYVDLGYKSPKGSVRGDADYNRFERSARRRRRALKSIGIEVIKVEWKKNPREILNKAELALKRVAHKVK